MTISPDESACSISSLGRLRRVPALAETNSILIQQCNFLSHSAVMWVTREGAAGCPSRRRIDRKARLTLVLVLTKPVQKQLFDGFVVSHQHMSDGVPAYDVADFFRNIFCVVAGAFERL